MVTAKILLPKRIRHFWHTKHLGREDAKKKGEKQHQTKRIISSCKNDAIEIHFSCATQEGSNLACY